MARARIKLSLSVGELARIKRRLHYVRDPERKKRLQAVCRAAEGQHTLAQLAGMAGCARSTIQRWLAQFDERGLEGLLEIKSPPGLTSPLARLEVQAQLHAGLEAGRWRNAAQVTAWLKETHGISLTPNYVQRRLRAMGGDFRRSPATPFKATPAAMAQRASRRREHPSAYDILSYDMGAQGAATMIRTMERSQRSQRAEECWQPPPIEVYLDAFFQMLETGECSLEEANRFLTEVKKEWQREERSE